MGNVYLISDTHFGHNNICHFLNKDGSKVRPWNNAEEMDEALIQNWNETVKPNDKVYHLGDVAIPRKGLQTLEKLNGKKILIRGNHDIFELKDYIKYFKDIRGYHKIDNFILSHIPIHSESLARWCEGNIHGHLHSNRVMKNGKIDSAYYNVCVECIEFKPIALEEVFRRMREARSRAD